MEFFQVLTMGDWPNLIVATETSFVEARDFVARKGQILVEKEIVVSGKTSVEFIVSVNEDGKVSRHVYYIQCHSVDKK